MDDDIKRKTKRSTEDSSSGYTGTNKDLYSPENESQIYAAELDSEMLKTRRTNRRVVLIVTIIVFVLLFFFFCLLNNIIADFRVLYHEVLSTNENLSELKRVGYTPFIFALSPALIYSTLFVITLITWLRFISGYANASNKALSDDASLDNESTKNVIAAFLSKVFQTG